MAVAALCQSLLLAALIAMSTPTPPLAHAPRASPAMPLPLAPRRHTKWTPRLPETCRADAVATWGQGVCYFFLLPWWGHVGRLLPSASASTTPRAESRAAVRSRSMWHPPTPSRAVVSVVLPLRAAVVLGWLLAPAEAAPTPDLPPPPLPGGIMVWLLAIVILGAAAMLRTRAALVDEMLRLAATPARTATLRRLRCPTWGKPSLFLSLAPCRTSSTWD